MPFFQTANKQSIIHSLMDNAIKVSQSVKAVSSFCKICCIFPGHKEGDGYSFSNGLIKLASPLILLNCVWRFLFHSFANVFCCKLFIAYQNIHIYIYFFFSFKITAWIMRVLKKTNANKPGTIYKSLTWDRAWNYRLTGSGLINYKKSTLMMFGK